MCSPRTMCKGHKKNTRGTPLTACNPHSPSPPVTLTPPTPLSTFGHLPSAHILTQCVCKLIFYRNTCTLLYLFTKNNISMCAVKNALLQVISLSISSPMSHQLTSFAAFFTF